MISFLFSSLLGWLGLGLVVSIGCGVAYWLIPEVPWLTDKLRQLLLIVAICSGTATFIYGKGAYDAQVAADAKIEREKADAINNAGKARSRLRSACARDSTKCLPNDWFRD